MNKKSKKVSNLQKIISENSNFQFIQNGKIKCKITKHQFLPTVQNFQQHLKSKSYKKAIEAQFDISEFEEFLQTHRQNKNFLFCKLTGAKFPKKKTAIEKHVKGRKFQKRVQQYKRMNPQEEDEQEEEDENVEEEIQQQQKVMVKDKKQQNITKKQNGGESKDSKSSGDKSRNNKGNNKGNNNGNNKGNNKSNDKSKGKPNSKNNRKDKSKSKSKDSKQKN